MPPANSTFLGEDQWETLLDSISGDYCTPILGPEVNTGALLQREQIAQQLSRDTHGYPLGAEKDLVQVSQYLSVTAANPLAWRTKVVQAIRQEAALNPGGADESYRILADLKLSIYVTTNFDRLMAAALRKRPAKIREELCPWNSSIQVRSPDKFPLRQPDFELSPAEPIVFYLFGNLESPASMVLSYHDHLDFLATVARKQEGLVFADSGDQFVLPNKLQDKLQRDYLLFLGYRINDFDFHILMRSLRSVLSANLSQGGNPLIAVQLECPANPQEGPRGQVVQWLHEYMRLLEADADDPVRKQQLADLRTYLENLEKTAQRLAQQLEQLREYLKTLCRLHKLEVIFGSCAEFIRELGRRQQARAASPVLAPAGVGP